MGEVPTAGSGVVQEAVTGRPRRRTGRWSWRRAGGRRRWRTRRQRRARWCGSGAPASPTCGRPGLEPAIAAADIHHYAADVQRAWSAEREVQTVAPRVVESAMLIQRAGSGGVTRDAGAGQRLQDFARRRVHGRCDGDAGEPEGCADGQRGTLSHIHIELRLPRLLLRRRHAAHWRRAVCRRRYHRCGCRSICGSSCRRRRGCGRGAGCGRERRRKGG